MPAIVLKPVTVHFRFMDLPPELRSMIWHLCYPVVDFNMSVRTFAAKQERKDAAPGLRVRSCESDPVGKSVKFQVDIQLPTCRLTPLLVNKEMSHDAAAVLYARMRFVCSQQTLPASFLQSLGSMRKYVTTLRLDHPTVRGLQDIAPWVHLTALRRIEFLHDIICKNREESAGARSPGEVAEKFATLVLPLAKSLLNSRSQDLVYVSNPDVSKCEDCQTGTSETRRCLKRPCQTACSDMAQHCKDLQSRIRGLLDEMLNCSSSSMWKSCVKWGAC